MADLDAATSADATFLAHVIRDDPGCDACGTCIGCDGCADEDHPVDLARGDCESCGACGECVEDCRRLRGRSFVEVTRGI